MPTELASSRQLHAGVVPWPDGRVTIVVKLTLVLGAGETFRIAPHEAAEPLSLDTFDEAGILIHPSDFAPFKPACDVVILSEADRALSGELVVGPLRRALSPFDAAGARETFCPGGDPTDPAALPLWAISGGDFTKFQTAPPHQRIPFPTAALDVSLRRGAARMEGRLVPPRVRFSSMGSGADPVARLTPQLDFVGLRADTARVVLVYRAVCDRSLARETLVAIDVAEHDERPVAEANTWRRSKLVRPADLVVARQAVRDATAAAPAPAPAERTMAVMSPLATGDALPFARSAADEATDVDPVARAYGTTRSSLSPADPPLPFVTGTAPEARPPISPEEFEALRHGAPVPAPSFEESETQVITWGREGALDRAIAVPASSSESPDTAGPADDALDPARVAAISRELWAGRENLATILARHGVSEEAWRKRRTRRT